MELATTWRSSYSLRCVPITFIQVVSAAGTVFVLSALQAASGPRLAHGRLDHARQMTEQAIKYLQEVGDTFASASGIAQILRNLLDHQVQGRLSRRIESSPQPNSSGAYSPGTLATHQQYMQQAQAYYPNAQQGFPSTSSPELPAWSSGGVYNPYQQSLYGLPDVLGPAPPIFQFHAGFGDNEPSAIGALAYGGLNSPSQLGLGIGAPLSQDASWYPGGLATIDNSVGAVSSSMNIGANVGYNLGMSPQDYNTQQHLQQQQQQHQQQQQQHQHLQQQQQQPAYHHHQNSQVQMRISDDYVIQALQYM
jgi:hypothetical protein